VPGLDVMTKALESLRLKAAHIIDDAGTPTELGENLEAYFKYRANVLNKTVKGNLMTVGEAKRAFERLKGELRPRCPLPMNKQKGQKKSPAYFTGIVNMLIEANAQGLTCEYDPY